MKSSRTYLLVRALPFAVLLAMIIIWLSVPVQAAGEIQIVAAKTPTIPAVKKQSKKILKTKTPTPAPKSQEDLTDLSLENLAGLNVIVTSSSKKAENLRDATSAIFVITQEDIRRSGMRTIPDLLVMVPGIQVARQSANEWAVSARGFNAQYNNKMLVLIDGRCVYNPVWGGVNWSEQDIPLEDIERIEVIRGPGGTLWGSNAVNGIVNIITKDSKVTQGLYMSASAGANLYAQGAYGTSALNGHGSFRYGGKLSDDLYYRVFTQAINQNPFENPKADPFEAALGNTWNDGWHDFRAGFRADLHSNRDKFSLQGEAHQGYFNYARLTTSITAFFNPFTFVSGNDLNTSIVRNINLLGRWSRDFEDDSRLEVLGYYDHRNLTTANDSRTSNISQANLEFEHRFHFGDWNEITWGGSYRNVTTQFLNPINIFFSAGDQNYNVYGGFLQDRLTLSEDLLFLTLGTKLENNFYTGNEWQPSGRLLFTPDDQNSLWASVSRAVRIPYQIGDSAVIYLAGIPAGALGGGNPPVNTYGAFIPNPNLASEILLSYELGYRTNLTGDMSLDIAAFYNHYEDLFAFQFLSGQFPSPAGGIIDSSILAIQAQNGGTGNIYGTEISAKWNPASNLKLNLTYTYQDYDQAMINSSNIEIGAPPPHHLLNFWAHYNPSPDWELNTGIYFTDTTYLYDPNDVAAVTPAYWEWNVGITWKPDSSTRLSLWAMDLEGAHTETLQSAFISPAQVVPSLYAQIAVEY